jgi:hypothetical protein
MTRVGVLTIGRQQELRPDCHLAHAVHGGTNPPAERQALDDAKTAPTDRGAARLVDLRHGLPATVAHRDLYPVVMQPPSDPDDATRQRGSVSQSVTDKFADHQAGITCRNLTDAGFPELTYQVPACYANARRRIREQNNARRTHLHALTPLVEPYQPA